MANGGRSPIPLLARRFLVSKSSDGFLSLISWVSVLGVALGVLALVVVTSVINGFQGELSRVITGMNGEVLFYSRGQSIQDPEGVMQRLRKAVPEIQAMTPSYQTEVMTAGPQGVAGSILEGVDLDTVALVTTLPHNVTEGRMPAARSEVVLGSALAERIGAKVGQDIRLIAPFVGESEGGAASPAKMFHVQVVGIVKMGLYEYDSKYVFSSLDSVQDFLDEKGRVTTFKLKLKPGSSSHDVSERLNESFGAPFRAKEWAQLNRNIFYAIQLEKVVLAILLTAIIIVAAFNVVSTLMMMIHDKTKEIGILKAMGLRPDQSFRLFCLIGVGIGATGTIAGVLAGLAITQLLSRTHFVQLPADIYYISFLPVVVRWIEIATIFGVAVLITFLATLFPAYRVSRQSPLEGLHYE